MAARKNRKKAPALEKKVKDDIRKLLDELGAWQFMPMQNMGRAGIPDHIACVPLTITPDMVGQSLGVMVVVEAKRLGKSPTPRQLDELQGVRDAHGFALVIAGRKTEPGSFQKVADALRTIFNAT